MSDNAPKSAVELAMERLRQKDAEDGVETTSLTDEQKAAVADAHQTYQAQVAECRILHESALMATTDPEKRRELEANHRRDLARFATDRDKKIAAARNARS